MPSGNVAAPTPAATRRVDSLDGLRGVAAFVVVVFHFLCMLAPGWVPDMTKQPHVLADTPVGILWNGPFAVSVFFVLSGFVIAGVAARRADLLVANAVARYVRLAVPITVSVVLAWAWLNALPTAADDLAAQFDNPSRWLGGTYQAPIPNMGFAVADGLFWNFYNGESLFNNVLWTMQIELIGSLGLFLIYGAARGRPRHVAIGLGLAVLVTGLTFQFAYLAFALGAILQELWRRGWHRTPWVWMPVAAFVLGVALGGFGRGAHDRLGLPLPLDIISLKLGKPEGAMPVVAATLILYGVLTSPALARTFSTAVPQWLGRVSFPLYLVHVPLLYTVIAYLYVAWDLGLAAAFALYLALTLVLAFVFTLLVEEPTLKTTRWVRGVIAGDQRRLALASARPPGAD